jgi:hypothetical protein
VRQVRQGKEIAAVLAKKELIIQPLVAAVQVVLA